MTAQNFSKSEAIRFGMITTKSYPDKSGRIHLKSCINDDTATSYNSGHAVRAYALTQMLGYASHFACPPAVSGHAVAIRALSANGKSGQNRR